MTIVDQGMLFGGSFQSVISTSYSPFSLRLIPLSSSQSGLSASNVHLSRGSLGLREIPSDVSQQMGART